MKIVIKKFLILSLTFLLLIILKIYLSFFGFGKFIKLIKKRSSNILNKDNIYLVAKSIAVTSSIIPKITCLIRAAALKIIFSDIKDLKLYIGINASDDIFFESHAWITFNKKVI